LTIHPAYFFLIQKSSIFGVKEGCQDRKVGKMKRVSGEMKVRRKKMYELREATVNL
jgi:hypothetical protein